MSLTKLCVLRGVTRSSVTKICNKYEIGEFADIKSLTSARDQLLNLQSKMLSQDNGIIELITEDNDLLKHATESQEREDKLVQVLSNIAIDIDKLVVKQRSDDDSIITRNSSSNDLQKAKLPLLKINPFNGDPLKWQEFWDSFESMVNEQTNLTAVVKFNYLLSFLDGDAKRAVDGIAVTNGNYPEALLILKERFGREDVVIFAHLNKIFSLPTASNTTFNLRQVYDNCEKHLRCLNVYGTLTIDQIFVPLLLSKLPSDIQILMQRKNGSDKWELSSLRKWLKQEIEARELVETNFGDKNNEKTLLKRKETYSKPTSLALVGQSSKISGENSKHKSKGKFNKISCIFCEGNHYSNKCTQFPDLNSRKNKLSGRCFRCFKPAHAVDSECQNTRACYFCNSTSHHTCLCPVKFSSERSNQSTSAMKVACSYNDNNKEFQGCKLNHQGILQTALAKVSNVSNSCGSLVRMILDIGCHKSYITERLSKYLNLDILWYESLSVSVFAASRERIIRVPIVELSIFCIDGSHISVPVCVVPTISCVTEYSAFDARNYPQLTELQFADDPDSLKNQPADLLIGGNYYYKFVKEKRIQINNDLLLLDSVFGWIPAGKENRSFQDTNLAHSLLVRSNEYNFFNLNLEIEKFWTLESIGIMDSGIITDDECALKKFNETISFKNGRYQVSWPWKNEVPNLPTNYQLTFGRFRSLINSHSKNPKFITEYDKIIKDQVHKGIIEKVNDSDWSKSLNIIHYIPHHCVEKLSGKITKLRIVYDASAKTCKVSPSLNECLLRGPLLMESLAAILMRFRLSPIGISCDIEKAFLQVGLHEGDRDVTRFLWLKDSRNLSLKNNVETFRFCRVPFGVISSPFLLAATIRHHLTVSGSPLAEKISRNIYVDNVLVGVNTVNEAIEFYADAKDLMNEASMNLREWCSNSREFMENIPASDQELLLDEVSILGVYWTPATDQIYVRNPKEIQNLTPTKRCVLQRISEVYDPLGLVSPVTLNSKIFMQELWKRKLGWNETLPSDLLDEWNCINDDLNKISTLKVKRFIGIKEEFMQVEYHCFCDASEKAYASVVYLLVRSAEKVRISIVFSKTKVAPLKQITIPRLELMALLLGVRATEYVCKELPYKAFSVILWSDSKCVLHWVHNDKKLMPVFVENRLREIRKNMSFEFRYVHTSENPADISSRGTRVKDLEHESIWWHGPKWLEESTENWPVKWKTLSAEEDTLKFNNEEFTEWPCTNLLIPSSTGVESPFQIEIERFSSLGRLLRVTAWVRRFVNRVRDRVSHTSEFLTSEELAGSLMLWEKYSQMMTFSIQISAIKKKIDNCLCKQLNLFIDSTKLIRCQSRLLNADVSYNSKFPKLISGTTYFARLLIFDVHERLCHTGARQTLAVICQNYWIPRGRSVVQKLLRECLICKIIDGKRYATPPIPPLPSSRVNKDYPFSCTGLDHFGPLYLQKEDNVYQKKVWVCLFTCAAVRAVHLEVVTTLSAEGTLQALKRFIARRGVPRTLISDNARGFKLANKVLNTLDTCFRDDTVQGYISDKGITWKFIVELAPWMGGFYERLVGTVKRAIKKSLGNASLSLDQLQTIICEIEGVINSRPLTYVEAELKDHQVLTPSDLLFINPRLGFPDFVQETALYKDQELTMNDLLQRWRNGQRILNTFWSTWKNDYLLSLRETQFGSKDRNVMQLEPSVGHIVLIKDKLPRSQWQLGKITSLNQSEDGRHRSANVMLPNKKVLNRPIKLLCPIEISNPVSTSSKDLETKNEPGQKVSSTTRRISNRVAAIQAGTKIAEMYHDEDQFSLGSVAKIEDLT